MNNMKELIVMQKKEIVKNRINEYLKDIKLDYTHTNEELNDLYIDYYELDKPVHIQYPSINFSEDVILGINGKFNINQKFKV